MIVHFYSVHNNNCEIRCRSCTYKFSVKAVPDLIYQCRCSKMLKVYSSSSPTTLTIVHSSHHHLPPQSAPTISLLHSSLELSSPAPHYLTLLPMSQSNYPPSPPLCPNYSPFHVFSSSYITLLSKLPFLPCPLHMSTSSPAPCPPTMLHLPISTSNLFPPCPRNHYLESPPLLYLCRLLSQSKSTVG